MLPRLGELVDEIRSCNRAVPSRDQTSPALRLGMAIYLLWIWLEFGVPLKSCEPNAIDSADK